MPLLPIVERELRVASRHSRTWWRRIFTFAVASFLFAVMYLTFSRWSSLSQMGAQLFSVFGGFGMLYALAAGPLAATDCLSREQREQTLGLLFLTKLRSYDVVLGKLSAVSIDIVYGLMAIIPLLTVPVLFGGVSLAQFVIVVIAVAAVSLMSLGIGVFCSSLFSSGRAALGLTILLLALLFFGLPFFVEVVLGIGSQLTLRPFLLMASPLYLMDVTLGSTVPRPLWPYWVAVGGHATLGFLGIIMASALTWKAWRGQPALSLSSRWLARFEQWRQRIQNRRVGWRPILDKSPMLWLEGRDFIQQNLLWGLALGCAVFLGIKHLQNPQGWPSNDMLYVWPLFSHYTFCIWLAVQSPRRLADDKTSGALELLLCTPLKPDEIIDGIMLASRRRYGRALAVLMALDLFLVFAYFDTRGDWDGFLRDNFHHLCLLCVLLFPLQAWSFARVGAYLGLAWGNSVRATLSVIFWLGLAPWFIFMVAMLMLEYARRSWQFPRNVSDHVTMIVWAMSHYLICGAFLFHAGSQLRKNFLLLATQPGTEPWWKQIRNGITKRFRA